MRWETSLAVAAAAPAVTDASQSQSRHGRFQVNVEAESFDVLRLAARFEVLKMVSSGGNAADVPHVPCNELNRACETVKCEEEQGWRLDACREIARGAYLP
jgi:hypothetical protein